MKHKKQRNKEAAQRARIARYFYKCLKELGVTPREVSKAAGVDPQTIRRLPKTVPQLRVLYPLGVYIQERARAQVV